MSSDSQNLRDEAGLDRVWPISSVFLLHGKGGSPNGTVNKLQNVLERHWPGLEFVRPALPHSDPNVPAEVSVEYLMQMQVPNGALLVGISLGGLVAAKLQELGREDLKVITISSPTWADNVLLEKRAELRIAFYSSRDAVIAPRVLRWPELASFSRDFDWLSHDTDQHLRYVVRFFDWCLEGSLARLIDHVQNESSTQQERDDAVWRSMADTRKVSSPWRESPWSGGRPQTFAEIGQVMESGHDWEYAWSDWLHEFIFRKDLRCLAEEPPSRFPRERRAMLAATAEFFAKLYGLTKPTWVHKPEYFLPKLDYYGCVINFGEAENALLMPETEAEDCRLRARTPKEFLRRNILLPARGLTVL
jgi:pimeloyl-ACP methyl ester carboxylesterase